MSYDRPGYGGSSAVPGRDVASGAADIAVIITPPIWWLAVVVIGTVAAVTVLTAVPARIGARRSVAVVLQTE